MTKVGLVLGAGGVVGQAFHAGVLAALELDLGWDPRNADVIVGSSAGSVSGTLLRLGVPAADLAAWAVEAPLSVEGSAVKEILGDTSADIPPIDPRYWFRPWRLPSPALLARVARRPWAFRPSTAATTLMPRGPVDITAKVDALHGISGDNWPAGLWICAVRRRDGGRVVFGRSGSPYARLGRAVAASCAIPGFFSPIAIGGVEYLDGGVHSPTNADVLRNEELDLVIVVSPMSAYRGVSTSADAPMRWSAHRHLEGEIKKLRSRGTVVVRFEPGPQTLAAMGLNAMAVDRGDRVVQASFLEAGRVANTESVTKRLQPITSRTARMRTQTTA